MEEYDGHPYRWHCMTCKNVWYSELQTEDLCPALYCESDDIYWTKLHSITREEMKKIIDRKNAAEEELGFVEKELNKLWLYNPNNGG